MKKASKIITLVGTGITAVLTLIGFIVGLAAIFTASEGVTVAVIAILFLIFFSAVNIALPAISFFFVLSKKAKLNFAGYIIAIVVGGMVVLSLILSGISVILGLSAVSGILALVGGIMGVVSAKK